MKAYHFLKDDMCGGYGDEPPWKVGETRSVKGQLVMCQHGYHASPSFYDALGYAKGNIACIVELSGKITKDTDKYVARTRKLIEAKNVETILRAWGCDCAERALKKAKITDTRSWDAIKIARLYNAGEATKEELTAAWAAAWGAAWAAARDAARGAAWTAAWDAARDAARDAAWGAAWGAAWTAAWAAARDAARDAARAAAWTAVWDAARAAARDAAWGAAWDAARDAARDAETNWQKRRLNKLIKDYFKEESCQK